MSLLSTHTEHLREFVQKVQQRANLDNYEEAHQLIRATLNTLGKSISRGEASQLADWLPVELQEELAEQSAQAHRFDKSHFIEDVGGNIHTTDPEQVENQASAALHEVRAAAPSGELDATIEQLPHGLAEMFR